MGVVICAAGQNIEQGGRPPLVVRRCRRRAMAAIGTELRWRLLDDARLAHICKKMVYVRIYICVCENVACAEATHMHSR